ncbi:MAG: phosphoesterase [Deltaproteobacteria bacterium]|nr:MAG: phosphoesterase [Deltaproteobacteria bacterium]
MSDPSQPYRVAVVGDIHLHWDDVDVRFFQNSDYDVVLFVGDLPEYRLGKVYAVARHLRTIGKPAFLIPGNHDALTMLQLAGEFLRKPWMVRLGSLGHQRRVRKLREALEPITLCGYSWHTLPNSDIALLAGRPHSMGGGLNVAPYLQQEFGVANLEASGELLCRLIDEIPHSRCILMGHHGPFGLGCEPGAPWGADFTPEPTDWGDHDLRVAVDYALSIGKEVRVVVAGHMHSPTKHKGRLREWATRKNRSWYVNAARVPRILEEDGVAQHHHIALDVYLEHTDVAEVWVSSTGEVRRESVEGIGA